MPSLWEPLPLEATDPIEFARSYGFGIVRAPDQAQSDLDAYLSDLSIEEYQSYVASRYGSALDQGCEGSSREATAEVILTEEQEDLLVDLNDEIQADARIVQIEARWIECIANSGWGYVGQSEAEMAIAARQAEGEDPDQFADLEIAIAMAFLECDLDRSAARIEVQREYEMLFVEEYLA